MNILKIADGVTGLFPRKIMVTLIDELSGKVIGEYKASKDSLPQEFDRPMVVAASGKQWQITKAESIGGKRLHIYIQEEKYFLQQNKRSMVPTLAARPSITTQGLSHDFKLEFEIEEWRQIEFLPTVLQESVEKEIKLIVDVAGKGGLLGYDRIHVREHTKEPSLRIPFYEFYQLVNGKEKGSIQLKEVGIIENGFFIQSEEYVYYGMQQEQVITLLCLQDFGYADDEFTKVIDEYNMILVNWPHRCIL
jgi:hypothetical protein